MGNNAPILAVKETLLKKECSPETVMGKSSLSRIRRLPDNSESR